MLPRYRNAFLTMASYVFYGWWEPWFVLLMMTSTVVDYICGGIIATPGVSPTRRRAAMVTAIVCDLGLLGFFKYYVFTAENLNVLLQVFGAGALPVLAITLPIGISFYTFESMSYTIDVYRGVVRRARSLSDLSCFISLFPHLVAGPIVRYNVVADQIAVRDHTCEKFAHGVALFILGFAKKTLLANPMGSLADSVFSAQSPLALDAWIGAIGYAFQIYFDFSGYSDMAVGLSRMFGFVIPKNFSTPYLAESITDFWRRWHISLSTWLRDYLYIPLGGNRLGKVRTYINLMLTMLLGGLWHGANWTFVVWGGIHGVGLAIERFFTRNRDVAATPSFFGRWARRIFVFNLVCLAWIFFRIPSFSGAWEQLVALLNWQWSPAYMTALVFLAAYILTLFLLDLQLEASNGEHVFASYPYSMRVLTGIAFCVLITLFGANQESAFIYFRF